MNKSFILLSCLMGIIVLSSNYLVQFPVNYYGLNEILTYGAFSYPVAFLITDLANRSYGKFVAKIFMGSSFKELNTKAQKIFKKVNIYKPKASRKNSKENFIICQFLC